MGNVRYLTNSILSDSIADKKITYLTGPRQVGKTTIAKSFIESEVNYKSWDDEFFRNAWIKSPLKSLADVGSGPVVLDEIHKDKKKWKNRVKGIFDYGFPQPIIITGSARLDTFRKGSDSMMGRYIPYRLHPFTVGESSKPSHFLEVLNYKKPNYKWDDLMKLSGFPDPLLKGSEQRAQRWSRLRLDSLINQDIRDEKAIQDIQAFRNLVSLLPEKISGTFSLNATKEDVGAAYATVRAWMALLHDFYYCFSIKPYSKKIKRSLLAEPKVYLYDLLQISKTNPGQRRENLVALHLLKACHFWTDTAQGEFELHYLRDKEKREVDFLITNDRKPWMLIECKSNSKEISKSLIYFKNILQIEHVFQLVSDSKYHREYPALGIQVIGNEKFFSNWI